MKILAVDTSTFMLACGIYDGEKTYSYNLQTGRLLSGLLVPTLQRAVDAAGMGMKEIDYFACGLGPGSFTGIRVGLAAMKGLSWSLRRPMVGIPTLDILARNVAEKDALIIPLIDAKRELVFSAFYRIRRGALKRTTPYMLTTIGEVCKRAGSGAIILGDAVSLYRHKIIACIKGARLLDKDCWFPLGHTLIALACEKIRSGKTTTAFNIKPLYLYPKECQIRKHTAHNAQRKAHSA